MKKSSVLYHKYSWVALTLKLLEIHGCVLSTVATDALVLKHQAISTHIAEKMFIVLNQFHTQMFGTWWTTSENKITF